MMRNGKNGVAWWRISLYFYCVGEKFGFYINPCHCVVLRCTTMRESFALSIFISLNFPINPFKIIATQCTHRSQFHENWENFPFSSHIFSQFFQKLQENALRQHPRYISEFWIRKIIFFLGNSVHDIQLVRINASAFLHEQMWIFRDELIIFPSTHGKQESSLKWCSL